MVHKLNWSKKVVSMTVHFGGLLYREDNECYLSNISLSQRDVDLIRMSRDEIRSHLKISYPQILEQMTRKHPKAPRFFTQGSFKYLTLNKPDKVPPQQADIDDGCYLPMEYITDIGKRPEIASKCVFQAADTALKSLCVKKNWELITTKETCVRIVINKTIHVDIPFYAIPQSKFSELEVARDSSRFMDSARDWSELPTDEVLLAHRKDGWIQSDPKRVSEWFTQCVQNKGEQLRRLIRYIKAIRDHHWVAGGPSSLLLMVIANEIYEPNSYDDGDALRALMMQLPDYFKMNICNPCDAGESLTDRLGREGCDEAYIYFKKINKDLEQACRIVTKDTKLEFILSLQEKVFGPRLPIDMSAVTVSEHYKIDGAPFSRTKAG